MADVEKASRFIRVEAVSAAWKELRRSSAHTHFFGYLAVLELARTLGRQYELEVNFWSFFERYLAAGGMEPKYPFLMPFAPDGKQNRNVAGSYAKSSLRDTAPILHVADIGTTSRRATFTLKEGHVDIARRLMLFEKPLPGLAFGAFLYRDYGFDASSAGPDGIASQLKHDFGLSEDAYDKLLGGPSDLELQFE